MSEYDNLLTPEAAAARCGMSLRHLNSTARARGHLTPVTLGGRTFYRADEVARYVREHLQAHRIEATGDQLEEKFRVDHAGQARRRRFLLGFLHDRQGSIELSSEVIELLNSLVKFGGYTGPLLGHSAELDANDALRYGEALEAAGLLDLARLTKAGRTLRFWGDK